MDNPTVEEQLELIKLTNQHIQDQQSNLNQSIIELINELHRENELMHSTFLNYFLGES